MRKIIKRTVTILLAAAMLLAVLPHTGFSAGAESVYSGTCGQNLTWSFDPDTGTLTIEGSGGMFDYDFDVYEGDVWGDYPSPWIAFADEITALSLPDGLTYIGCHAFDSCTGLTSVEIPGSVTGIGEFAFSMCSSLSAVEIPDSVKYIGRYAFGGCSALSAVSLPKGLKTLDDGLFSGCTALTAIEIPNSVTFLGNAVFSSCTGLSSVTIPNSVTTMQDGVFYECTGLSAVELPDSVTYLGRTAFGQCTNLSSVKLPAELTEISEELFYWCTSLSDVNIPDSVTAIGDHAFHNCRSLSAAALPDGLTSLGNYAFYYCVSLPEVKIPAGVKVIGDKSFTGCSSLRTLTLSEGLTGIGQEAFAGCSSLSKLSVPKTVTEIGFAAFSQCSALKSLKLQEGLKAIHSYTFSYCPSLTAVTVPASVSSIEGNAFYGCLSLRSLVVRNPDCTAWMWYDYYEDSGEDLISERMTYRGTLGDPEYTELYLYENPEHENSEGFNLNDNGNDVHLDYLTNYCKHFGNRWYQLGKFSDVKENAYYEIPVAWAVGNKITSGTGSGKFSPSKTCTREQIVTFLWKACGSPEPESTEITFSDVKPGKYYVKPILWAVENKITGGVGGGKFGVGKACTREQAMTFLWKACGSPEPETTENPFTDVKEGKYYVKPILWAVENKITGGTSATTFGVGKTCTRAQIVTFLYKAAGFLPE